MAESKTVRVSILDKDYQVSCAPEEVAALQKSAAFLDQKMREMRENSNVIGLDRLAVMAALNLTNDLLAQSEKATELGSRQSEIESRLSARDAEIAGLATKLDAALTRLRDKLAQVFKTSGRFGAAVVLPHLRVAAFIKHDLGKLVMRQRGRKVAPAVDHGDELGQRRSRGGAQLVRSDQEACCLHQRGALPARGLMQRLQGHFA